MRRAVVWVAAVMIFALGPASFAAAIPPAEVSGVSITLDRQRLNTRIGTRFELVSTVRNDGNQPVTGLIAHQDVVAVDRGVYVDPEDWSTQRTVYLNPLQPHATVDVPWRVQAVNDGHFVLFVSVAPQGGPARLAVSDGLRLSVVAQRTIGAVGVLPLVLGVPCAVLAVFILTRARRRSVPMRRGHRP